MKRSILFVGLAVLLGFACSQPEPTVDDIVAKWVEANGGDAAFNNINDQVTEWNFRMVSMPHASAEMEEMAETEMGEEEEMENMQDMEEQEGSEMMDAPEMPMIFTYKKPDKLRMDIRDMSGEMVVCYNGTNVWASHSDMDMEMTEAESQEWQLMASTWVDGLRNYQDKGLTLELLPDETIDNVQCKVIQATDQYGGVSKFYLDQDYFIVRHDGETTDMMTKEKQKQYMTLSNYKMVDGIAIAHDVANYSPDGTLLWESELRKVNHNTGVADDMFMQQMTMK